MEIIEVMLPGVTGFSNPNEDLGQQDHKEFEAYLYAAIRAVNGELIEKELVTNNKNFYTYKIKNRENGFYILLHSVYPFVAFASVVEYSGIQFIDGSEPIKSIFISTYKVLPKDLLDQPLIYNQLKLLSEVERKMIEYWKPEMIGEVIFNYWD